MKVFGYFNEVFRMSSSFHTPPSVVRSLGTPYPSPVKEVEEKENNTNKENQAPASKYFHSVSETRFSSKARSNALNIPVINEKNHKEDIIFVKGCRNLSPSELPMEASLYASVKQANVRQFLNMPTVFIKENICITELQGLEICKGLNHKQASRNPRHVFNEVFPIDGEKIYNYIFKIIHDVPPGISILREGRFELQVINSRDGHFEFRIYDAKYKSNMDTEGTIVSPKFMNYRIIISNFLIKEAQQIVSFSNNRFYELCEEIDLNPHLLARHIVENKLSELFDTSHYQWNKGWNHIKKLRDDGWIFGIKASNKNTKKKYRIEGILNYPFKIYLYKNFIGNNLRVVQKYIDSFPDMRFQFIKNYIKENFIFSAIKFSISMDFKVSDIKPENVLLSYRKFKTIHIDFRDEGAVTIAAMDSEKNPIIKCFYEIFSAWLDTIYPNWNDKIKHPNKEKFFTDLAQYVERSASKFMIHRENLLAAFIKLKSDYSDVE